MALEYIPASTPFTHSACSRLNGAPGGSTGTPGMPDGMPARKPARYRRSCSPRTGGGAGSSPNAAGPDTAGCAGTAMPASDAGAVSRAPAGAGACVVTGAAALVSVTAHTLNSGWKDSGSTASLVTALTLRYSPNRSFQWNGAKQQPGRTRSVTTAGSTARPRREATSTAIPVGEAQLGRVLRVHLHERAGVELVQPGHPGRFRQRVPLVLERPVLSTYG